MKTNSILALATVFAVSSLYLPVVQACEKGFGYQFEHMLTIVNTVDNKNSDIESYQFSVDNCVKMKGNSDIQVSQNMLNKRFSSMDVKQIN